MLFPHDQLQFIHIPKTAGTTLIQILDRYFPQNDIMPAQLWREFTRLDPSTITNFRLFQGHFGGAGLDPFVRRPLKKITMLRDPMTLALSRYGHMRRESNTTNHEFLVAKTLPFAESLHHPLLLKRGHNSTISHLSFTWNPSTDLLQLFRLRQHHDVNHWISSNKVRLTDEEAFTVAKQRLEACVFFGLVEHFAESMLLMAYTFGAPPIRRIHRHRNFGCGSQASALSEEVSERFKKLNRHDLEFYEFGRKLFFQRYHTMVQALKKYDCGKRPDCGSTRPSPDELYPLIDAHYQRTRRNWVPHRGRSLRYDFSEELWGDGWHRREETPTGPKYFRWTGPGTKATVDLPIKLKGDIELTIRIVNVTQRSNLDLLQIEVNGRPVPLEILSGHGTEVRTLRAIVSARRWIIHKSHLRLCIRTPDTCSPKSADPSNPDDRNVGVAVNWIDVKPFSLGRKRSLVTRFLGRAAPMLTNQA